MRAQNSHNKSRRSRFAMCFAIVFAAWSGAASSPSLSDVSSRALLIGEWTGIVDDPATLVTVRFHDSDSGTLIVSKAHGDSITSTPYRFTNFEFRNGTVNIGSKDGPMVLNAKLKRTAGGIGPIGSGSGHVHWREGSKERHSGAVEFFYNEKQSWVEKMVEVAGMQ
jgi:hypothetical protein